MIILRQREWGRREVWRGHEGVTVVGQINGNLHEAVQVEQVCLPDGFFHRLVRVENFPIRHIQCLCQVVRRVTRQVFHVVKQNKTPVMDTGAVIGDGTHTALQHRKGVIVVGEPGVGKTALGATLAIALRPHMKPGQVVIVTAPPHLTGKWQREVEMVARSVGVRVYAKVLKTVDDMRAFMDADLPLTLKVGIIPREMAKLGEGWEPAVQWRIVRTPRWNSREARPYDTTGDRIVSLKVPICPSCSATVTRTKNGEAVIADETWLSRAPQKCPSCGSPLWQFARTFSAPKAGEKFPRRNPRMPLAEYIAAVFPHRVYLYLCDEVHEAKSTTTDQGAAMMTLAQTAEKVVGLTGTLYGGTASSLYGLEFTFNPRVREQYPWGVKGQAGWVRDMGALERIVEYRPEYDKGGHYTGKRRIEQKPKEAPGCSPLLVREIIDHTVFVGLADIGRAMPDFEETPVPIPMDADMALHYHRAKDKMGIYLFQRRMEGDASFLGKYLQTLLSWPTAPFRAERIIHKRRLDRESDAFIEIPVHDMPGLAEDRLYPKEQWLVDLIRDELAQDRNVGVFLRQTGTRDIASMSLAQSRLCSRAVWHRNAARAWSGSSWRRASMCSSATRA